MTFTAPEFHPECQPAYQGCTCRCHSTPGMRHVVACCRPKCRTCGDSGTVNTFTHPVRESNAVENWPGPCPDCNPTGATMPIPAIFQIEGPDAAGKTTVTQAVADVLTQKSLKVQKARAPGGTRLGESLRSMCLDPNVDACPWALSLMFTAAEVQSFVMYREQLAAGADLILADRGFLSNLAYRYADGIPVVDSIAIAATAGVMVPTSRLFYLDVPADVREARIAARAGAKDRLEARGMEYQRKVVTGYEACVDMGHCTRIDGNRSVDEVAADIAHRIWAALVF